MTSAKLEFVVGKGGVGKSTVSAALGLASARAGRRTLIVEIGGPGGVSRGLGVTPHEANVAVAVQQDLFCMYVEGDSALAEYLAMVVPVRRLLRSIFESTAYRTFVAAAPGLKELMAVGKIWFEATRKEGGRLAWDAIVVDAGASGHSLQYLEMPQAAARTFSSGLVHRESERVASLLADSESTKIHVVATPEEMPLVEAEEIVTALRKLGLTLGSVFVNRCRQIAPEGASALVARVEARAQSQGPSSVAAGLATVGRAGLSWQEVQKRGVAKLEEQSGVRCDLLPLLVAEEFGTSELRELSAILQSYRHRAEEASKAGGGE